MSLENQQIATLDLVYPTFIRKKERLAITKLLDAHLVDSNSVSTRSQIACLEKYGLIRAFIK